MVYICCPAHQMLIIILLFQTLDIAVVCSGHSTSRQVVILIKSILFYRRNPLHFHFVSDKTAITILTTLFQSWNIPLGKRIHLYIPCYTTKNVTALLWVVNFASLLQIVYKLQQTCQFHQVAITSVLKSGLL